MIGSMNRMAIDVAELRKGMYVAEPDRPWIDLPLPFAGFTIQTDEELRILRQYCNYVYIDPERGTEPDDERELGVAESSGVIRKPTRRAAPATTDLDDDVLDEHRRYADPERLKPELEAASKVIAGARKFLDEAFVGAGRGKSVDVPAAQSTITDLIVRLTRSPTASLLLTSLNKRDSFTVTHSVHVCVLVLAFCMRAQVDDNKLEILGLGALLHDIGKARLPQEMINRAGPLAEHEWEMIKRHPIEGHRILADSDHVPNAVLNIARMHHERRDGMGYPYGLTKNDLPEYVLVAGMINRYQALTSPRPYREATAPDKVLRSFYAEADDLYGSKPVEALIRCVGIYPVGCVVELDNGALGVVVGSRPNRRLRPTVQLVRTPDGDPYDKLVLLNLAAEAEKWERRNAESWVRQVRKVRSSADTGIDPGQVIAETYGVQIH